MSANKACLTRLQKEYKALLKDPVPHIAAHPSNSLLEWHFVLEGAKGTDYEGGIYHGKLVFPPQYPFKPPSISLFTPNGRFAVNTKLCLSMTDYHPESWNPMWSVGTILTGLLSFMVDPQPTTGSIDTTSADKKRFASESLTFNMKNPTFRKLFPNWVEAAEAAAAGQSRPGPGPGPQQQGQAQAQQSASQQGSDRPAAAGDGQQQPAEASGQGRGGGGPGTAPGQGDKEGAHSKGSSAMTIALMVVLLAMAVVPLLGFGGRGSVKLPGS